MHQNSLFAFAEQKTKLSGRAMDILAAIKKIPPVTDRQIMSIMGFGEPNAVRPRLTELIQMGLVEECGSVRCKVTGKTVRVVKAI